MTESEFNASLNNTISEYISHGNHLAEKRAIKDAHHEEMMKLIDHLNEVKRDYRKLAESYDKYVAAYNEKTDIIAEHLHEMSISREEINQRVEKAIFDYQKQQGTAT